jgi:endonuclease III-like uncharacterized protein
MAMSKMHKEVMDKLEAIHKDMKGGSTVKKSKVTKAQLTAIKGVGDATADEILKLLND